MMRKIRENRRAVAGVFLFAGAVFFAGCGAGNGTGQTVETEPSVTAKNNTEEEQAEIPDFRQAQIRHYYGGILSQVMAAWRLPDMELGTGTADDDFDSIEMEKNCFAVADVDQDGREELLVRWTTTITAGEIEAVYDYNPDRGEVKREFIAYPALTYYDNGMLKAEWSHNQAPPAEFWPFTLYQYDPESDSYVEVGSVRAWDDEVEGWDFPAEVDVDGDGTIYEIVKAGEEYQAYEGFQYDQADFDEWFGEYTGDAKELTIEYLPMKYESFEEWTVGSKDGKELFSFEALNAGSIGYRGEKLENVTIFGIYPGISVDGAWEKLKAYGFYATAYPEVENCLVTGEGFGNISIWFSAEDNVVTDITVMPYCAFAG